MGNIRSSVDGFRVRVVLGAAVILAALATGPRLVSAGTSDGAPLNTHIVEAGETLWKIARDNAPDEDPRSYVYELKRLNHLTSVQVFPGQSLRLPP